MKYLDKLNLDSELTFGTEIEFKGPEIFGLSKKYSNLPMEYIRRHCSSKLEFNKWCLDTDSSVTIEKNGKLYGGELSSSIFYNQEEDWNDLLLFCEALKSEKAYISRNCSNHISVGSSVFENDKNFFILFSKVIAVFENEIKLFSYGEYLKERAAIETFSRPLQKTLLDKYKTQIFSSPYLNYEMFMYRLCYDQINSNIKHFRDGAVINFDFYYNTGFKGSYDRIEFRYPNGSINPVVIQNNINFFLKIVLSIMHNRFDLEYLEHVIKEYLKNTRFLKHKAFSIENMKRLLEAICLDSNDRDNFEEQFERVRTIKGINYI